MSFSKASKKMSKQEMAQVESSDRSRSPFWGSRASSKQRLPSRPKDVDRSAPIGAAYSHASVLNYSDGIAPSPRARSPSTSSFSDLPGAKSSYKTNSRSGAPLAQGASRDQLATAGRKWSSRGESEDEDEEAKDPVDRSLGLFDEEEDEFGLPSIANSRKNARSVQGPSLGRTRTDTRGGMPGGLLLTEPIAGAQSNRNGTSDIAEERQAPEYPDAKSSKKKILRPQYKDILEDPVNSIHLIKHPQLSPNATRKEVDSLTARTSRINKFKRILQASSVSLSELRDSAWSGVPEEVRCITWQVLLGYLPTSVERRVVTLQRKRRDYLESVRQVFERNAIAPTSPANGRLLSSSASGRGRGLDESVWHQISIDVPRTSPHIELYSYEATQRSLERILYLWAIRHPASGYVQGINDLVTPFWQVFLGAYVTDPNIESGMDPGQMPKAVIDAVEADSYWCLTKLLDGIQDSYIYAQPGIVRQVGALRDLTHRIDKGLAKHLEREGIEFMQFSFRWMNCLLMREVNIRCTIRMWDTYMSEEQGFSEFHLYVCAAFLVKWTDQLLKLDFQEIMMFLQALPTKSWGEKEIELLLSEAFIWQSLFRGSSAHLKNPEEARAVN